MGGMAERGDEFQAPLELLVGGPDLAQEVVQVPHQRRHHEAQARVGRACHGGLDDGRHRKLVLDQRERFVGAGCLVVNCCLHHCSLQTFAANVCNHSRGIAMVKGNLCRGTVQAAAAAAEINENKPLPHLRACVDTRRKRRVAHGRCRDRRARRAGRRRALR